MNCFPQNFPCSAAKHTNGIKLQIIQPEASLRSRLHDSPWAVAAHLLTPLQRSRLTDGATQLPSVLSRVVSELQVQFSASIGTSVAVKTSGHAGWFGSPCTMWWSQGPHHHHSFPCCSSDQEMPWPRHGPFQQHPKFHTWHHSQPLHTWCYSFLVAELFISRKI